MSYVEAVRERIWGKVSRVVWQLTGVLHCCNWPVWSWDLELSIPFDLEAAAAEVWLCTATPIWINIIPMRIEAAKRVLRIQLGFGSLVSCFVALWFIHCSLYETDEWNNIISRMYSTLLWSVVCAEYISSAN